MRTLSLTLLPVALMAACSASSPSCTLTTGESGESLYRCGDESITLDGLTPDGAAGASGRDGAFARGILEGNLQLNSDYDIARYQEVTEVTGNLIAIGYSGMPESIVLPNLKRVGGDLLLLSSADVRHIDFPSLESVGGSLAIEDIAGLESMGSFGKLTEIGGDLYIGRSDIPQIDFPSLKSVGGTLTIEGIAGLESMGSFGKLTDIGGYLWMSDIDGPITRIEAFNALETLGENMYFDTFSSVTELDILRSLQTIGYVTVCDMPELVSLSGFDHAQYIPNGGLELCGLPKATSVPSFDELIEATDGVWIYDLDALESLGNFSKLTTAYNLDISGNASLQKLPSFPSLTALDGGLYFAYLPSLTAITGFTALQSTYDLNIKNNDVLESLGGFGSLTYVDADIRINNNPHLCSSSQIDSFLSAFYTRGGTLSGSTYNTGNDDGC